MKIIKALNKKNELKCENQKLKDQLKKTEEKVKIFEKKKDFQNAKIEKLRKEYMKIIKALSKENAQIKAKRKDFEGQVTKITFEMAKKEK
jgi:hypothetical protein